MALRVKLNHVARRASGRVATGNGSFGGAGSGDASIRIFERNEDGSNGAAPSVFDSLADATPNIGPYFSDDKGRYSVWVGEPGQYNVVETIDGVEMPPFLWEAVAANLEPWREVGAGGEPAFNSTWTNLGFGFDTTAFRKSSEGIVFLKGVPNRGATANENVFTLPAGYRPSKTLVFATLSNDLFKRCDILSTGVVDSNVTSNTWISLAGIVFRAEQ